MVRCLCIAGRGEAGFGRPSCATCEAIIGRVSPTGCEEALWEIENESSSPKIIPY